MSTNIFEDGEVVVTRTVGPLGPSYQVTVASGPMRGDYATVPVVAAILAARAILKDAADRCILTEEEARGASAGT